MRTWFKRQRYIVDYAATSLWRRKAKSLLLWLVYAALVFALASILLFGSAIRREASAILDGAPDVVGQGMVMGRHQFVHAEDVGKLAQIRGADRIEARLWGYHFDTAAGANYTLQVPSRFQSAFAPAPGEAIIGEGVARARKVEAGRFLFLVSAGGKLMKLKVAGILPTASALVSSDLVLVSEADFRAFFSLPPDVFTDIAMRVRNPSEIATVAEKGAIALPGHRFITKANMQRTYEALFGWREGLMLATLSGALLAFVILSFDRASGLSAQERREIGILKAVGWDTTDVIGMKLWEGGLISMSAFAVGFLVAYLHVFFFSGALFAPVLKGWSTLYPNFKLTPTIEPLELTTLAFFTIAPYIAAILVPVWRVASGDPETVMR